MKITQLVSKPQLIKIELLDDEILKEFNEAIEFHTWDRQPLDVFMKIANATSGKLDSNQIIEIVKDLILNEEGNPVLVDGAMLPTGVLMKAITKITELLGK